MKAAISSIWLMSSLLMALPLSALTEVGTSMLT